jgi:hybrid cluster-associated redox disulfide protein
MDKGYNIELNDENASNDFESVNIDNTSTQDRDRKPSSKLISKGMLIADVVDEHPDLVPAIMDYGVHCVGCGAAMFETLEEGFMGHGMEDEEITKIVDDLNELIKQNSK